MTSEFECSVTYTLHFTSDEATDKVHAEALWTACDVLIRKWTKGYVWNDEPFRIRFPRDRAAPFRSLSGSMRFGDCVEDEWFVVLLLKRISLAFPKEVFVEVLDDDGQFILIEAAEVLPEWISPETSRNRVFLYGGDLHIISQEVHAKSPTVDQARKCVKSDRLVTIASADIRKTIERRLDAVSPKEWTHNAWCVLPAHVADALERFPTLVAHAVNAFYRRDSVDSKAASKLYMTLRRKSSKGASKNDCQCRRATRVRFSRSLYAKLRAHRFFPPKGFENYLPDLETDPAYAACERGLKMCAALEILASRCKKQVDFELAKAQIALRSEDGGAGGCGNRVVSRPSLPDSIRAIATSTYGLEDEAMESWRQAYGDGVSGEGGAGGCASPAAVARALLSSSTSIDVDHKCCQETPSFENGKFKDDPDEWIRVAPEEVERMLKKYAFDADALSREVEADDVAKEEAEKMEAEGEEEEKARSTSFPRAVASAVRRFVDYDKATMDGAVEPPLENGGTNSSTGSGSITSSSRSRSSRRSRRNRRRRRPLIVECDDDDDDDDTASHDGSDDGSDVAIRPDVLMGLLSGTSAKSTSPSTDSEKKTTTYDGTTFANGQTATIHGLKGRTEYNGKTCKVVRWLGTRRGRYATKLVDFPSVSLSVRPHNLRPLRTMITSTETLMAQMDDELKGTTIDKSFDGAALHHSAANETDRKVPESEDGDEDRELKVDMNLVRNMMKSFEMQHGLPGPASNVLGGMGLSMPVNDGGDGTGGA